jgi:ectoine hydroxylase-related dioxygenase (phytanoyl-CoA dioxygenase family)
MSLTDEQIAQYHEKGYLVFEGLIPKELVTKYIHLFKPMVNVAAEQFKESHWSDPGFSFNTSTTGKVLHKIQGVVNHVPEVLELINYKPIVEKVRTILGQEKGIHGFGTKFYPMLPGHTTVGWHQDNYYFGTNSERIISCAVYLEPTTPENGCFRVVPSSHKMEIMKHTPGVGEWANGEWIDSDEVANVLTGPKDIACQLPGTVVLFSSCLIHAAYPNSSNDKTRYSLFWHYIDADLDFSWRGLDFSFGKYQDINFFL